MNMSTSCGPGLWASPGWGRRYFETFSGAHGFCCYNLFLFFIGRSFRGEGGRIPRVNTELNGYLNLISFSPIWRLKAHAGVYEL